MTTHPTHADIDAAAEEYRAAVRAKDDADATLAMKSAEYGQAMGVADQAEAEVQRALLGLLELVGAQDPEPTDDTPEEGGVDTDVDMSIN